MVDIFTALKDTPVPSLLVIGGFILLVLALAGRIAGQVELPPARQTFAGIVGGVMLILGVALYSTPTASPLSPSTATAIPTAPAIESPVAQTMTQISDSPVPGALLPPTTAISPTTVSNTMPKLPEGCYRLEEAIYGRFDPEVPANVQLDAGRTYCYTSERTGRYCRAEFAPNGLIWVLCAKIGLPEPTERPPTRLPVPPTSAQISPTRLSTPTPLTSATYRVNIEKISLEEIITLPGCQQLAHSPELGETNNACIVGPGKLDMQVENLDAHSTHPFPSDARQLFLVHGNRARVTVVSNGSGLSIITEGNNVVVPEPGQYYKIVVAAVS